MRFGVYPGGRAGTTCSHPADPAAIEELVDELAGGRPLLIREYVHFFGAGPDPGTVASLGAEHELDRLPMPDEWYTRGGRELDLVVSYLPATADLPGWLAFLDTVIDRYGRLTRYLQVTLEPNFPLPLIDGSSPGVFEALTVGLPYARTALNRRGLDHVRVGFSVAEPAEWLGGDDAFWQRLADLPPDVFATHVDYVGLGLYPDAFAPVAPGDIAALTAHAIDHLRDHCLPRAHIPATVPMHIAENGSPSVPPRSEADQARSLSDMIGTVLDRSTAANITRYELFSLRDADSGSAEALGGLGLVSDTYHRKEAFAVFRDVIARHGR
ncbi:MAG TPA: hypothetical protein VN408_39365 [Actinoplanes sp.]|nr:hypothetical protein [Actinoplanes sp.]